MARMLLRHQPTGDVYIYTPELALRNDMVVIEDEPAPAKKPARKKAASSSSTPKAESNVESEDEDVFSLFEE